MGGPCSKRLSKSGLIVQKQDLHNYVGNAITLNCSVVDPRKTKFKYLQTTSEFPWRSHDMILSNHRVNPSRLAMIVENTIFPPQFLSPLQTWRLESELLNSIFIAVLTTILSYQLTAIIFDLLQGLKTAGIATAAELHIRLLCYDASTSSLLSTVIRRDTLDQYRLKPSSPNVALPRVPRAISAVVLSKLFILLLSAPLFNLLSIIISSEVDEAISFSKARLGGFALGYDPSRITNETRANFEECSRLDVQPIPRAHSVVDFFRCPGIVARQRLPSNDGDFLSINVGKTIRGTVDIHIREPSREGSRLIHSMDLYGSMHSGNETYRLTEVVDFKAANDIIKKGFEIAESDCGMGELTTEKNVWADGNYSLTKQLFCPNFTERTGNEMLSSLSSAITIVEMMELILVNQLDLPFDRSITPPFKSGMNLPVLRQRKNLVSEGVLCLLVLSVLVLRVAVKCFTNNDIETGLGAILSTYCDVPTNSSLLSEDRLVEFNKDQTPRDVVSVYKNDGYFEDWSALESALPSNKDSMSSDS